MPSRLRLRVPELLRERQMTAYGLHKESGGRISLSAAYRLAKGDFGYVSRTTLEALVDVFKIDDPGPLFEKRSGRRKR